MWRKTIKLDEVDKKTDLWIRNKSEFLFLSSDIFIGRSWLSVFRFRIFKLFSAVSPSLLFSNFSPFSNVSKVLIVRVSIIFSFLSSSQIFSFIFVTDRFKRKPNFFLFSLTFPARWIWCDFLSSSVFFWLNIFGAVPILIEGMSVHTATPVYVLIEFPSGEDFR